MGKDFYFAYINWENLNRGGDYRFNIKEVKNIFTADYWGAVEKTKNITPDESKTKTNMAFGIAIAIVVVVTIIIGYKAWHRRRDEEKDNADQSNNST